MTRTTRRRFLAAFGIGSAWTAHRADTDAPTLDADDSARLADGDHFETAGESHRWRGGPSMPDERTEVAATTFDDRMYVIGGFVPEDAGDRPATADVAVFHPGDENWTYAEPMPAARHHVGIATTNERVYVVGGFEGDFRPVDSVWTFDGETWDARAPLPTGRGALAVGVVDGRLHAVGGLGTDVTLATHEVYDPETDDWTEAVPMPTPREHLTSGVVDGELYAIGGRVDANNLGTTEVYDPEADAWEGVTSIPTARSGHVATVLDRRIHVFGGESSERTFDEAEVYDPVEDRWAPLERMPTPRHGLGAAALDGDVYVASGGPEPGFSYSAVLEILERE